MKQTSAVELYRHARRNPLTVGRLRRRILFVLSVLLTAGGIEAQQPTDSIPRVDPSTTIGLKNPALAGTLSLLIPGAGSFYAGALGHGTEDLAASLIGVGLVVAGRALKPDALHGCAFRECDYSTYERDDFVSRVVRLVGGMVLIVNVPRSVVTAIKDAKAHNRRVTISMPAARIFGNLYLEPRVGLSRTKRYHVLRLKVLRWRF